MDLYITSLLLGAVGLGAMAVTGLGARGGGHSGHAGHGHAGHLPAGGHGHAGHAGGAHGGHAHAGHSHGSHPTHGPTGRVLSLMSPRVVTLTVGMPNREAFLRMDQARVKAAPVLDAEGRGVVARGSRAGGGPAFRSLAMK